MPQYIGDVRLSPLNVPGGFEVVKEDQLLQRLAAHFSKHRLQAVSLPLGRHLQTAGKCLHAYYNLLSQYTFDGPSDAQPLDGTLIIAADEPNVQAIIMAALDQDQTEDAIDAALQFTNYLYWTHPQTEVISKAVDVARRAHQRRLPECLESFGDILRIQSRNEEAKLVLREAQEECSKAGDRLGVANCLRGLGDIMRMQGQHDSAIITLKQAQTEFTKIGNKLGAAQCRRTLGNILRMRGDYEEAKSLLQQAQVEFTEAGDLFGAAQCQKSLGRVLCLQDRYEEARDTMQQAHTQFTKVGDQLGVTQCLQSLGDILALLGDDAQATAALDEAQTQFTQIGNKLGAAQCFKSLGYIHKGAGDISSARRAFEQAAGLYQSLGFDKDHMGCMEQIVNLPVNSSLGV